MFREIAGHPDGRPHGRSRKNRDLLPQHPPAVARRQGLTRVTCIIGNHCTKIGYDDIYRAARVVAAQRDKRFLTELASEESEPERLQRDEQASRERIKSLRASDGGRPTSRIAGDHERQAFSRREQPALFDRPRSGENAQAPHRNRTSRCRSRNKGRTPARLSGPCDRRRHGALGCGEFFPRNLAMADGLTASPSSIGFADRNVVELRRPSALATPSRMPHKSPPFVKIYYQSTNFLKDGNA